MPRASVDFTEETIKEFREAFALFDKDGARRAARLILFFFPFCAAQRWQHLGGRAGHGDAQHGAEPHGRRAAADDLGGGRGRQRADRLCRVCDAHGAQDEQHGPRRGDPGGV
ncbi:calmodulin 1 [Gracilaria domingensis]|nr:calmodulin 1 [Gracilaria domingensis]